MSMMIVTIKSCLFADTHSPVDCLSHIKVFISCRVWVYIITEYCIFRMNYDRFENLPPLPVDVHVTKGSVHIIASRAFVQFVIHNSTAIKFRDWIKKSFYPDETFFSSLNHSPKLGVPGAYLGSYTCRLSFV